MSKKIAINSPGSHGSSSSPRGGNKSIKLGFDGTIMCDHDVPTLCKTAGPRSSRCGEEFLGCPFWQNSDCGFFVWKNEVKEVLAMKEEEVTMANMKDEMKKLKEENLKLVEKLAKMQAKKTKFEEQVRAMMLKISEESKTNKIHIKIVLVVIVVVLIGRVLHLV